MCDLISREAVINLLCELRVDNVAVNGKRITELINELPTAYDVEKVVGEIRNQPFGNYGVQEENEIIDIVRRGGVE